MLTPNEHSYRGNGYSGLEGSGVGIAILDSGKMSACRNFDNAFGLSRVARNVNMRNASLTDWLVGVDSLLSPAPNSLALLNCENRILNNQTSTHDPYGHGTHVTGVATGRGLYNKAPDSTETARARAASATCLRAVSG